MFNKEELQSIYTLLSDRGTFALNGKEMEGFIFLKNKILQEYNKLVPTANEPIQIPERAGAELTTE